MSNLSPKSKLVNFDSPHCSNIYVILVTLLVSNKSPKFNVVIAFCPQESNIYPISVTFDVSNFVPKSNVVIAFNPVNLNIEFILVTLVTFNNSIFVIVSVDVDSSELPIYANKYFEFLFPNISSLLPIYSFIVPFALGSYHAIIELSCIADTSHAVVSIYVFVYMSYTSAGMLSTNVTLSTIFLATPVFPNKASNSISPVLSSIS